MGRRPQDGCACCHPSFRSGSAAGTEAMGKGTFNPGASFYWVMHKLVAAYLPLLLAAILPLLVLARMPVLPGLACSGGGVGPPPERFSHAADYPVIEGTGI